MIVFDLSVHFRDSAISNNAFLIGSPACRLGVVVDGGQVSMSTMTPVACRKWSSKYFRDRNFVWNKSDRVANACCFGTWEIACDTPIVVKCWSHVPTHIAIELPCSLRF